MILRLLPLYIHRHVNISGPTTVLALFLFFFTSGHHSRRVESFRTGIGDLGLYSDSAIFQGSTPLSIW